MIRYDIFDVRPNKWTVWCATLNDCMYHFTSAWPGSVCACALRLINTPKWSTCVSICDTKIIISTSLIQNQYRIFYFSACPMCVTTINFIVNSVSGICCVLNINASPTTTMRLALISVISLLLFLCVCLFVYDNFVLLSSLYECEAGIDIPLKREAAKVFINLYFVHSSIRSDWRVSVSPLVVSSNRIRTYLQIYTCE